MSIGTYILYLPDVALEKIFSFLTYNEIAKTREVCKQFNHVCGNLLSRGFIQVEKRHSTIYKRMKTMLPRRESERRSHPLARHCDILSAVETRISMLNMTFSRYIEAGLCCFYPGKVIDEIVNVLNTIELLLPPPRTHELLQELRDISSMAMEHFEEFILPNLKAHMEHTSVSLLPTQQIKNNKYVFVKFSLANDVRKIKKQNKIYREQITQMTNQIDKLTKREKSIFSKLKEHSTKLRDHERKYNGQAQKISEQEAIIVDLRKHIDEWEQKFNDFAAEMRARDEFNDKPKEISPKIGNTPISLGQNIKPRIAQVLGKSFSSELERKRKYSLNSDLAPIKFARSDNNKEENCTTNVKLFGETLKKESANINLTNENQQLNQIQENMSLIKRNETFFSSLLESIIKNPITSIKSRKRKMSEDININDV
nr:F-box only protein 28 [Onthophagus taurus]